MAAIPLLAAATILFVQAAPPTAGAGRQLAIAPVAACACVPLSTAVPSVRMVIRSAIAREAIRLAASPARVAKRRGEPGQRSWIARHPTLVGASAGFGAGFLIGYLPGDDGAFEDFSAEFGGLVIGAAGAGAGALVGTLIGGARR